MDSFSSEIFIRTLFITVSILLIVRDLFKPSFMLDLCGGLSKNGPPRVYLNTWRNCLENIRRCDFFGFHRRDLSLEASLKISKVHIISS